MTALDRAFIKAFDRHGHVGSRAIPRGATVTLSEAIRTSSARPKVAEPSQTDPIYSGEPAETGSGPPSTSPAGTTPELEQKGHGRIDAAGAADESVVPAPHFTVAGVASASRGSSAQTHRTMLDASGIRHEAHVHQAAWADAADARTASDEESRTKPADQPAAAPFRPMLQVERFPWPRICHQLQARAADPLELMVDALAAAPSQGRRVLGLCACRRGEGATTLALAAARQLANNGLRVALVDADFGNPQLAQRLHLLPQSGWGEMLEGSLPLEEAVIETADRRLALLPQIEPRPDLADFAKQRLADSLAVLRAHYDLVLVDLEPLAGASEERSPLAAAVHRQLDAMVLIQRPGTTGWEKLDAVRTRLQTTGPAVVGVIQNFV